MKESSSAAELNIDGRMRLRGPWLKSQPGSDSAAMARALRAKVAHQLETDPRGGNELPPMIPDHTLVGRIGKGAYGEVWLARNALGTFRAIKIVYRARFEDERPYEREFKGILRYEPVSRSHEGLVAILHVGHNAQAGCFYYVMELADNAAELAQKANACQSSLEANGDSNPSLTGAGDGSSTQHQAGIPNPQRYLPHTLQAELRRRIKLAPDEAGELVLRLAHTLDHLHAHGLVHRDVKPSNVIFVAGRPKLADIGLITGAGDSCSFVGTEGFIPPEGPGTAQADIYSLGKLLYEVVTGRDRLDFPQLPAELSHCPEGVRVLELNEIITRACAPHPDERYRAAKQLSAELNLFLSGRSLRQIHQLHQRMWWAKRLGGAAAVLLIAAATTVWFAKAEARRALGRADAAKQAARVEASLRQRAEAAEATSRQDLFTALLQQARATVRSGEVGQRIQALDAIKRAAAISNSPALRTVAMAALALPDLEFQRELQLPPDIAAASLDPDFQRLALCRTNGDVAIHSTADGQLLATLQPKLRLAAGIVKWSSLTHGRERQTSNPAPPGRLAEFVAFERDYGPNNDGGQVDIWELASGSCVLERRDVPHGAFAFHPSMPVAIVAEGGGWTGVWDLNGGRELSRCRLPADPLLLSYSPAGDRFAAACERKPGWAVSVYRTSDGRALSSHPFTDLIMNLAWHPSGRSIAVADVGGAIYLMDAETGEARTLGRHKAQAVETVFSPEGHYLISGGWERELICWDLERHERALSINLGGFEAQFRSDGRECAVFPLSAVQFHRFAFPGMEFAFPEDLGGRVREGVFSPDGHWLAVSGKERLAVWDLGAPGPGALISQGADARPCFSSGHEIFASGNAGCFGWRIFPGGNSTAPGLLPLGFSPSRDSAWVCLAGKELLLTSGQGSRYLPSFSESNSPGSGAEANSVGVSNAPVVNTAKPTVGGVSCASPGGRWLAIFRPFTPLLYLYHLPDMAPVAVLTNRFNILRCRFSPTGDEVAIGSPRGVEFWSTLTWQRTGELKNFMDVLYDIQGRALWLTKDYRTAGLYARETLEPLLPLPPGTLPLALSPDGQHLAVSIDARRVQVWNLSALRQHFRTLGVDWVDPLSTSTSTTASLLSH